MHPAYVALNKSGGREKGGGGGGGVGRGGGAGAESFSEGCVGRVTVNSVTVTL